MVKVGPVVRAEAKSAKAKAHTPTPVRFRANAKGTKLLDLPEEVLQHIASFLVPDWAAITLDVELNDDRRSPGDSSLLHLARFNRTCKAVYAQTVGYLFKDVTCTANFRWERVGHHVDRLISSLWCFTDHGTAAAKATAAKLAKRFPNAMIAVAQASVSPNKAITISFLRLIAPEHETAPWIWTCTKPSPVAITQLQAKVPHDRSALPHWLASYRIEGFVVTYARVQDKLRMPSIFHLPIKNHKGMVAIEWDCNETRPTGEFLPEFKKQLAKYPEGPKKRLKWEYVYVEPHMLNDVGFVQRDYDGLMRDMGVWGTERFPKAAVTLSFIDKKTDAKLGGTHWSLGGRHREGPRMV